MCCDEVPSSGQDVPVVVAERVSSTICVDGRWRNARSCCAGSLSPCSTRWPTHTARKDVGVGRHSVLEWVRSGRRHSHHRYLITRDADGRSSWSGAKEEKGSLPNISLRAVSRVSWELGLHYTCMHSRWWYRSRRRRQDGRRHRGGGSAPRAARSLLAALAPTRRTPTRAPQCSAAAWRRLACGDR